MIFDLHSHTLFSDGVLSTRELASRAVEKGVDVLAITDHDTIDAYAESAPHPKQLKLVAGIELSTQWGSAGIHVLGLNVDLHSDAIRSAARIQSQTRLERAMRISENLEKKGIEDAFDRCKKSIGWGLYRPPAFCPVPDRHRQGGLHAQRVQKVHG